MICCCCFFRSREEKPELDDMGLFCGKRRQREGKGSEGTGDHNVQPVSAMDVEMSVMREDFSQDAREQKERDKLRVGTPQLATQLTPTESNSESKEPDNGLQIELIPLTPSVVESCADAPTAGCRGNKSPSPVSLVVPPHVTSQVSEHSHTYSSVSGGRAASGSGSDQQLVSPLKPRADSSDRHQWQSDGTPPPANPGDDGSHAHTPDGLNNRATAEEEEEEDGGGSHLKDKAPPQGCGTVNGRIEDPTGLFHEREATGRLRSSPHVTTMHSVPVVAQSCSSLVPVLAQCL